MAAKKNYHKPPEDPRTIGSGLKAHGRARRERLPVASCRAIARDGA